MKKLVSILLCAVMLCTLTMPALAIEPLRCDPPLPPPAEPSVEPTPPEWIAAEDYMVFPGDEVYLPENWAKVLELRTKAENGAVTLDLSSIVGDHLYNSAGSRYEVGLLWLKCAENAGLTATKEGRDAFRSAGRAFSAASNSWWNTIKEEDALYYRLQLYELRACLLFQHDYNCNPKTLDAIFSHLDMTLDDFFDAPHMELVPEEARTKMAAELYEYQNRIELTIDGQTLRPDEKSEFRNEQIMVPIQPAVEALGAVVKWDESTNTVTMTRAGRVVNITIGSQTATIDGIPVQMDVAPYISGDRILIPVRFMAESFGQKANWVESQRTIAIEEDKAAAGKSNMEAWALPMGAMLTRQTNQASITQFGLWPRSITMFFATSNAGPASDFEMLRPSELCRRTLSQSWNVNSREDLILTVCSMTVSGHNASFLANAAYINSLSPAQYNRFRDAYEINTYMVPYTKQLSEKWGDRGILCWDLFRMSNLVQWGYVAGYLTYAEALALLEPAARRLCENFSSWDEAYENYLDGYNWWARNNVLDQDIWQTERGRIYQRMREFDIFDDSLFKTGVISVPGVTAEELLESVLG